MRFNCMFNCIILYFIELISSLAIWMAMFTYQINRKLLPTYVYAESNYTHYISVSTRHGRRAILFSFESFFIVRDTAVKHPSRNTKLSDFLIFERIHVTIIAREAAGSLCLISSSVRWYNAAMRTRIYVLWSLVSSNV